MTATPIPPHVVHTVFQYILPPSLPMPPHLLSTPLIERHHFLAISATDAASYLCWPSSCTDQVAEALESGFQDALISEPEHDVRYSAPDHETLLAHVRPHDESPLQIVFAWDAGTETWRYHDARMLPFPKTSLSSLDVALADRRKVLSTVESLCRDENQPPHGSRSSSPTDDDYWAGYHSDSSSNAPAIPPNVVGTDDDERAEAAYWASYSTVHGSGDSTLPSPILDKRHLLQSHTESDPHGLDSPDPLIAHLHLRLPREENGSINHPFPSHRLESPDSPQSPNIQFDTTLSSATQWREQADAQNYQFPRINGLKMNGLKGSHLSCEHGMCTVGATIAGGKSHNDWDDGAVTEAVRGIYRMWKAETPSATPGVFVEMVKLALEGL